MAGANSKRVKAANDSTLQQLFLGFAATTTIYLLHLLFFRSGRSWRRLFLFVFTETIGVSLWRWLQGMADKGEELAQQGMVTYMFDVIYVTWFVHLSTALVSAQFWKVYWVIPLYALYRLALFILPRFFPNLAALIPGFPSAAAPSSSSHAGAGAPAEAATPAEPLRANQPKPDSKRQQKLQKRAEKGDRRVQYQEKKQSA